MTAAKNNGATPARAGFYMVTLQDGQTLIAEWRARSKKEKAQWWQYASEHPTIEKTPRALEGVVSFSSASREAVSQLLSRELTRDERIQKAYNDHLLMAEKGDGQPIPDNRRLAIGDEVIVGNLRNVTVAGLFEEGRVVVIEYDGGKQDAEGRVLRAMSWLDVLLKSASRPTRLTRATVMQGGYFNSDLSSLIHRVHRYGVDDNPDYQRGYVWTEGDQQKYLESVFMGRELGRFIFLKRAYPHRDQLFDGKQRMKTLMDFVSSRIAYQGIYWHELSTHDRNVFEGRSVQWANLSESDYSRADLLTIFLEVNAAGVPQAEEHLAYVRELLAKELMNSQQSMDS